MSCPCTIHPNIFCCWIGDQAIHTELLLNFSASNIYSVFMHIQSTSLLGEIIPCRYCGYCPFLVLSLGRHISCGNFLMLVGSEIQIGPGISRGRRMQSTIFDLPGYLVYMKSGFLCSQSFQIYFKCTLIVDS